MSFESQAFFKIVKTLKNDHYLSGNERMDLGNFFISKYFHLKENEDIFIWDLHLNEDWLKTKATEAL